MQLSGNMGIRFGLDDSGFGHPGQGGQYGWADPGRELSFAYLRNYLELQDDLAPMDALYEALADVSDEPVPRRRPTGQPGGRMSILLIAGSPPATAPRWGLDARPVWRPGPAVAPTTSSSRATELPTW